MAKVTFQSVCSAKSGTDLSEIIEAEKIKIKMPCEKGKCGKCLCKVTGDVSEPTPNEKKVLSEKQLAKGVRLACEVVVFGDVVVEKIPKK